MTKSTHRLVFFTVIVVLLTIPAEILLLRALAVPDQKEAVREWAMSLSADERKTELGRVHAYSVLYRRELMRSASPEFRAGVWQTQLDVYRQTRPGLDVNTVALLESLRAMLTPEFFDTPTREQREAVVGLAGQLAAVIGTDDATFLMHNLGPADGTFATYEPTAMYLTNKLRGLFAARAQSYECDCMPYWGCYSDGDRCQTDVCSQGQTWPYCGWYWSEDCTGICLAGW